MSRRITADRIRFALDAMKQLTRLDPSDGSCCSTSGWGCFSAAQLQRYVCIQRFLTGSNATLCDPFRAKIKLFSPQTAFRNRFKARR
jgi:hypothetical protein